MSKGEKKSAVPKLRFPEFREAGEWDIKPLRRISENLDNKRIPISESERVKGLVPYYGASGVIDYVKDFIFDEDLLCISEDGANLVTRTYPVAFPISGQTWVNNHAHVLKFENDYTQVLVENYLNSIPLEDFLTGMAQPKLNRAKLDIIPIPLPQPPEQQKIAECLSSLDDLIAAQSEKLKALQAHKKGLMQQVFPAEGEKVPRRRFGEFEGAGEWEEKDLGELIDIKGRIGYRGYTIADIVKKGEGAIALSPSNINDNETLSFEKSTYISWFKYEESPEIKLEEGQTILVKTGSSYGKAALIKQLPEKSTINPQLVVLKPKKVDSVFLFLMVSHSSIQRQINETVVGGAIPTLSQDSISKFNVLVPGKDEQQKVATLLTSLDDLITAQTQKIAALKTHKKGLMQQLFPDPNDVES